MIGCNRRPPFCRAHPDPDSCPSLARPANHVRVGFSILPVSNRERAGASIPIRSATSASVKPRLSPAVLEREIKSSVAAKLFESTTSDGRWRIGFAACCRRIASSSAPCSAVRSNFIVDFGRLLVVFVRPSCGIVAGGTRRIWADDADDDLLAGRASDGCAQVSAAS